MEPVLQTEHQTTITQFSLLILFKEIIAVYSENYTKPINTKYSVIGFLDSWDIRIITTRL
jgi:hypothetical protein